MKKLEEDGKSPLDSLLFGFGQPLKVYWMNAKFGISRFEGYSPNFLFYMRLGFLIPYLLYTWLTYYTMNGDLPQYFYLWTYWGWTIGLVSQIFSMLAAHDPEYWHVTAFAWLEVSHSINLAVTFAFWLILMPVYFIFHPPKDEMYETEEQKEYIDKYIIFIIVHMSVLHGYPLIVSTFNIYYTDIKLLKVDWKLMIFHGYFYMFADWLGFFDTGHYIYPIITWDSYPLTILYFTIGIWFMCVGFYKCFCSWADLHWKRRGEI